MASASVLTATPTLPTFYSVDHLRKPSSSAASPYLGSPPAKSYHVSPTIAGPAYNDKYDMNKTRYTSPGATVIPTTPPKPSTSTHAKLHKKVIVRSPRRSSAIDEQHQRADSVYAHPQSPPTTPSPNKHALDYDIPIQNAQKSPAKQAKSIIKQNFRKLSQAQDDNQTTAIDLSKTAEENEKASGLGLITNPMLRNSRSADVLRSNAIGGHHARSYSHVSQLSTTSIPYQPPTPFVPPLHSASIYSTPATYGFPSPAFPTTDFGILPNTYTITDDHNLYSSNRNRGLTIDSANSGGANSSQKQSSRVHSSRSSNRHGIATSNTSQTNLSSFTRPRRSSTNQSIDTSANPGRSRTSFDRAFTFLSNTHTGGSYISNKDDILLNDPVAQRAATIQAARQAFDDRQEAKARRYEEKEARAAEKQIRKEEKQRRKSSAGGGAKGATRVDSHASEVARPLPGGVFVQGPGSAEDVTTGATTFSAFPMLSTVSSNSHEIGNGNADFASSIVRPSTSQSANTPSPYYESPLREDLEGGLGMDSGSGTDTRGGAREGDEDERASNVPKVSKKRAAKSRYFWFLSWVKTRILNLGRK